jgi:hypothetical protein
VRAAGLPELKLPAFFRPSSWLGTSSLSYFPDVGPAFDMNAYKPVSRY